MLRIELHGLLLYLKINRYSWDKRNYFVLWMHRLIFLYFVYCTYFTRINKIIIRFLKLFVLKIVKYLWVNVHWVIVHGTVRIYFMVRNFRDIGGKDILKWTWDCLSVLEWEPFQTCFPKSQTPSNRAGLAFCRVTGSPFFYCLQIQF